MERAFLYATLLAAFGFLTCLALAQWNAAAICFLILALSAFGAAANETEE